MYLHNRLKGEAFCRTKLEPPNLPYHLSTSPGLIIRIDTNMLTIVQYPLVPIPLRLRPQLGDDSNLAISIGPAYAESPDYNAYNCECGDHSGMANH
jgi:hypothetical protein